jgi:transposase
MFGLGPATKIYIAVEGVDMRKGFDGLFGLVRDRLGQDPLSELAMLINGLDLAEARPRKNWLRRLPAA